MRSVNSIIISSVLLFLVLLTLNSLKFYQELLEYERIDHDSREIQLKVIVEDMAKISNALFDNLINTSEVINIFKHAHDGDDKVQARVRAELFELLKDRYENFTLYGVQQLHFHLPNNDSFLRFHRPSKFGDNLTNVRASVAFVNEHKHPISGFEEGKIFNGYRFVYPLFDEKNTHLGSVEISASLLSFKEIYERANKKHVDYILKRDVVESKLFSSELKNYVLYNGFDDFVIQDILHQDNVTHKDFAIRNIILGKLDQSETFRKQLRQIEPISYVKLHEMRLYSVDFIPFYNDFTHKKVGYIVLFNESEFFKYAIDQYIIQFVIILLVSIGFGFAMFYYSRTLIQEQKEIENKRYTQEVIEAKNLLESIMSSTEEMIYYKDCNLSYIGCNDSFAKAHGKSKEEIIGLNDYALYDRELAQRIRSIEKIILQSEQANIHESWIEFQEVGKIYVHISLSVFRDSTMNKGILGVARDMTELHLAKEMLEHQAYTDALTGINNRKAFNEKLIELLQTYTRYEAPFSIALLDIDDFKKINDNYGHDKGDEALKALCELISHNTRGNDYLYRVGGEEFVVLFPHTSIGNAHGVMEKIRKDVENNLEVIPGVLMTISVGLCEVRDGDTPNSIYKRVDELMYESKHNGKNRVSV